MMFASSAVCAAEATAHRGTNFTIDTVESGPISLNEKSEPGGEKPPIFYKDHDSTVGFNEDGEPNVGTRF